MAPAKLQGKLGNIGQHEEYSMNSIVCHVECTKQNKAKQKLLAKLFNESYMSSQLWSIFKNVPDAGFKSALKLWRVKIFFIMFSICLEYLTFYHIITYSSFKIRIEIKICSVSLSDFGLLSHLKPAFIFYSR